MIVQNANFGNLHKEYQNGKAMGKIRKRFDIELFSNKRVDGNKGVKPMPKCRQLPKKTKRVF
jgi:hypothetical protein